MGTMSTPVSLDTFVGPPVHAITQDGIAFYDNAYGVGHVIPLHVHAEPVLSLVLAGEGVEEVGSRTRALAPQDLLFTPSHAPHGYRFGVKGQVPRILSQSHRADGSFVFLSMAVGASTLHR